MTIAATLHDRVRRSIVGGQVTREDGGEAVEYRRSSFHGEHFELGSVAGRGAGAFTTIFSRGEEP